MYLAYHWRGAFPLLGYWERFDDIDFSKLPKFLVIKCNNDSGSTKIIDDKDNLTQQDSDEMKKYFPGN